MAGFQSQIEMWERQMTQKRPDPPIGPFMVVYDALDCPPTQIIYGRPAINAYLSHLMTP